MPNASPEAPSPAESSRPYTVRFLTDSRGPIHTGNAYASHADADRAADYLRREGGCADAWVEGFGSSSVRGQS